MTSVESETENINIVNLKRMKIELKTKSDIITGLLGRNIELIKELDNCIKKRKKVGDNTINDLVLMPLKELIPEFGEKDKNTVISLPIPEKELVESMNDGIELYLLFDSTFLKYEVVDDLVKKEKEILEGKIEKETIEGASLYLNPKEPVISEELMNESEKISEFEDKRREVALKLADILLQMKNLGCRMIELRKYGG